MGGEWYLRCPPVVSCVFTVCRYDDQLVRLDSWIIGDFVASPRSLWITANAQSYTPCMTYVLLGQILSRRYLDCLTGEVALEQKLSTFDGAPIISLLR